MSSSPSITQSFLALSEAKRTLANNLTEIGLDSTPDESLQILASRVADAGSKLPIAGPGEYDVLDSTGTTHKIVIGTNALSYNNLPSEVDPVTGDKVCKIRNYALGEGSSAFGDGAIAFGPYSFAEGQKTAAYGDMSHAEGASSDTRRATVSNIVYTSSTNETTITLAYVGTDINTNYVLGIFKSLRTVKSYSALRRPRTVTESTQPGVNYDITVVMSGNLTSEILLGDIFMILQDPSARTTYTQDSGAYGRFSHSEGDNTLAFGVASHAECYETISDGIASHAEGDSSQAIGRASHAEGTQTKAEKENSHAEGFDTHATGTDSHAEGDSSQAIGRASHAEGDSTSANGWASHAEGYNTQALGDDAHAEGAVTKASGNYSHAEGSRTRALGFVSHVEGYYAAASGNYSHAEGHYAAASGSAAHAGGDHSIARGLNSFAHGYQSLAEGSSSVAIGNRVGAEGDYSCAFNSYTSALNRYSSAFGYYTNTNADYQAVFGRYNELTSAALFVVGNGTADNTRANAFTVNMDGTATVAADPVNNLDVSTKGYVDTKVVNETANLFNSSGFTSYSYTVSSHNEVLLNTIIQDTGLYVINQVGGSSSSSSYTKIQVHTTQGDTATEVFIVKSNKSFKVYDFGSYYCFEGHMIDGTGTDLGYDIVSVNKSSYYSVEIVISNTSVTSLDICKFTGAPNSSVIYNAQNLPIITAQ